MCLTYYSKKDRQIKADILHKTYSKNLSILQNMKEIAINRKNGNILKLHYCT